MKNLRFTLFLVFGCTLAGCAGKNVVVTNAAAVRAAKPKTAPIRVFLAGQEPDRPFTPVAVAQVAGDENDLRENVEQLQEEARKLGADGVVIKNLSTVADRGPFRTTYQTVKEGTIIVFR